MKSEEDMPDAKGSKDLETIAIEKQVAINRIDPDNIKPIFVNDLMVGHTENEFFLTFSTIEPAKFHSEDELKNLEAIDAIARVKLVLTPDFARRASKALATNIERYEERLENDEGHHKHKTNED